MTFKGLILGIFSAFAFIGLYFVAVTKMSADNVFQFEEMLGLFFLTLIAVGGFLIIYVKCAGEVLFHFMEKIADSYNASGNTREARLWYQRCLHLDDQLLSNTASRVLVMGKLSKIYDHDGHPELVHQLELRKERVLRCRRVRHGRRTVLKNTVESSWLYRYIFVLLFGIAAIVFSINSSVQTASMIFLVGIALNGYWLHGSRDDAVS